MPVFEYKGYQHNRRTAGTLLAESPRAAREQLRRSGIDISHVRQSRKRAHTEQTWRIPRKSTAAVANILQELSAMTAVGTPIVEALDLIVAQHKGHLKYLLLNLRDLVASGHSLSEAMRQQNGFFDDMTIAVVAVGENTGELEMVLARLANLKQRRQSLANRVGTAMIYPIMVMIMAIAVAIFLMTAVVPKLLDTLIADGRPLPFATLVVKSISNSLLSHWALLLLCLIGSILVCSALLQIDYIRRSWHYLQLKIPLIGPLLCKQHVIQLSTLMAALLRAGVQFVDALRLIRQTTHNAIFVESMVGWEDAVISGRDIASSLAASPFYPPILQRVFRVGQRSGQLEQMLEQLAETYDAQLLIATQRLTAIIEPLLIIFLVAFIGFIAIATILPIMEAANVL